MTVVQTVLVYVLIPAAVYGLIALLTLVPKKSRAPRYRPGQEWSYDPVWWSANPVGHQVESHVERESVTTARTARGGARGNW